ASKAVSPDISSRTRAGGQAREKKARTDSRNSSCAFESANSMSRSPGRSPSRSITLGQTEDALRDDIALHLARAGLDRVGARAQVVENPTATVAIPQMRARSQHFQRRLRQTLVHLAPIQLLD